jgi:hypothetical protein
MTASSWLWGQSLLRPWHSKPPAPDDRHGSDSKHLRTPRRTHNEKGHTSARKACPMARA